MRLDLELNDMDLVKDNFEKNTTINEIDGKIKNSLTKEFKLGISKNNEDRKLALNYITLFEQTDESENIISKASVEYVFLFNDKTNEIINKLQEKGLEEKDMKELVIYLDEKSYPYVREYIENKYKRANMEVKLPFEFKEDN